MLLAASGIVVKTTAGRLARALVFVHQQINHRRRRMVRHSLAFGLQVLGRLLSDMAHQAEGHFIGHRQRPHWHAGLARFGLDHRRRHAFAEHGDAFVGKGAEYSRGKETATVVDHNRGFLDLQYEVKPSGQGFVAGARPLDDFHQGHLVHGAEEVQADELGLIGHRRGQAADGQGGGVGGDHRVGPHHALRCGRDLGLECAVFEYGLDDQVAAGQAGVILSRMNARQGGFALFGGQLPTADFLVQQCGRMSFAFFGGGQGDVFEHHLDTRTGTDIGDARAHHPGAEHTDFARYIRRKALRARAAGVDLVELEPEGADHVLRHLPGHQFGEVTGFDQVRGVEVHLGALDRCTQDFLRRGEAALGLATQDRRRNGEHLRDFRVGRRAAGNRVALVVPGLPDLRISQNPGTGLGQQCLAIRRQLINQTRLQGLGGPHLFAFEQIRQGFFQAEHAHHAHHAAAPWQQAKGDFRQAQLHGLVVQRDPVMAGQANFPTAAQGRAIDRGHHRFAEGFQAA